MIGRLALAQLRAHRTQTAWLAGLLTVLAGIVTAILVMGATQAALAETVLAAVRGGGDRQVYLQATLGEAPEGWEEAHPAELAPAAAQAEAGRLRAETGVFPSEPADDWLGAELIPLVAFADGAATEGLITAGEAPDHAGEIALSPELANRLDAELGDTITLWKPRWGSTAQPPPVDPITFTVVGQSYSSTLPGYDLYDVPGALVSWDEATAPGGALVDRYTFLGSPVDVVDVSVTWSGPSPVLDAYVNYPTASGATRGTIALPAATGPWLGAAGALVAAMVIMSFAVGRSQAASRTQWVGTVRTLGASRRYVATATGLETLVIALIAVVAGSAVGMAFAQAHLWVARALVAHPFGTGTITVHPATVPIVAGVLALVAVVVAAVPSFWASRVPAAAALKPVNDVTEAELSRRVPVAWLWIPFAVSCLALVWASADPYGSLAALGALGGIGASVTGFSLGLEWTRRWVPAVGRRLARSHRTHLVAAGDSLRLRPRQAVAPAVISAVGIGILAWVLIISSSNLALSLVAPEVLDSSPRAVLGWAFEDTFSAGFRASVVVVALTTQLVVAAIAVSHRAAVTRETAALRALGLSTLDATRAAWWQQWIPQVIGITIGILAVEALCLPVGIIEVYPSRAGALALRGVIALVPISAIAIAYLALAALVAWIVARSTTRATAVAALLPAS